MRGDIAVAGIARDGGSPRRRVGLRRQVRRNGSPGPEPDGDGVRGHLGGDDAAALGVEGRAEARGRRVADAAAHVLALGRVADVAVGRVQVAGEARGLDAAAGGRVQRHAVVGLVVHALDDVDFAVGGPRGAGAEQPEGGPDTAARGHVREIDDEEARVVGFGAVEADGVAFGRVWGRGVETEVDGVGG